MRTPKPSILVFSLFVCGWVLAVSGDVLGADKKKIAVLEFNSRGIPADVGASLTELVIREVDRSGLFTTISMDDIKAMLQHAEHTISLGCDDTTCLAEIGGALGVELLLAGSVGRIGQTYVISLRLIDVKRAGILSREEKTVQGQVDDLVEASRMAVKALLRPLMKKAAGQLELICEEEGAEVYVDDLMIGTTPLGKRQLPGGYHAIKVKKDRFVVFGKDVMIQPEKTIRIEVALIPSPEFVEAYESRASTGRALAWTFTAIAVAAAGAATGLFVWNEGRLGDYEQDKTRYETELVGDGYALNDRADSINMIDSVTWAVGGLAVASLGTALYFWVAGDPPGKYDHLSQETRVETSWDLTPSVGPGGAGVAACFRF